MIFFQHSGAIAKEFEEWEKEIEEDVDEFDLKAKYADYYYGGTNVPVADNYLTDDDNSYYAAKSGDKVTTKFEKPSIKNHYRKDKPLGDSKSESSGLSADEIKKIDDMISGTPIAKEIMEQHEANQKRMRKLRRHMEAEFGDSMDQMNELVKHLRKKEYEISRRIDNLGTKYSLELKKVFKKHEKETAIWFYPFLFVFVFVVTGTGVAYGKFRQHMKTHLLQIVERVAQFA